MIWLVQFWCGNGLFIFGNKHKNNTNSLEFHSYCGKSSVKNEETPTFDAVSIGVAIYENIFVCNCIVFINNGFTSDLLNLGKIYLCRDKRSVFPSTESLGNVKIYIIRNKSIVFSTGK